MRDRHWLLTGIVVTGINAFLSGQAYRANGLWNKWTLGLLSMSIASCVCTYVVNAMNDPDEVGDDPEL